MTNTTDLPYKNPNLPAEERIADLLGRMTLEEKVGQMMQLDARSGDLDDLIVNKHVGSILHTSPADLPRAVETVNTKTRLGIPLIIGDDCIHGYSFWPGSTIFPSQLGMATSFDTAKVQAAGRATAEEVSTTGVHWTFSPVLCIARDTRWGRVGETFGEDPYLIGEMASSIVKGYQGGAKAGEPLAKDAILACAKHFAGYSETQGGRDASEADLSHRKLESWFLPPFERVAKEGCGTFMLGYESIEGVPVTFNKWLLSDKLRGAWNYQGTLITDWDNVGRSVWEQKVKPDYVQAAADAVKSGNDLVMTTPKFYEGAIEAVKTGLLDESLIDAAVARILALKFRLGLFEDPRLPDQKRIDAVIGSEEHQQLNLEVAREAVALLKNDGSLPFNVAGAKRIAVVGPLADAVLHRHIEVVGRSDTFVLVVVGTRQHRPENGNIEFVVAQRRIGVVDNLLGQHREVVEHGARSRSAAHERIHRRAIGRTVGDKRDPADIGLDHLYRINLANKKGVGEVETVPVMPAQVVALRVVGETRRRDGRKENPHLGSGGGLLPRRTATARNGAEGRKQNNNNTVHKRSVLCANIVFFRLQSYHPPGERGSSGGFAR